MEKFRRFIFKYSFLLSFIATIFSIVAINGFFGFYNAEYLNPWLYLSELLHKISAKEPSKTLTVTIFTAIAYFVPAILISASVYYLFAKKYFDLYKLISIKRGYITNFLFNMLDEKMRFISKVANNIEDGVEMEQDEINRVQGKVLKSLSRSNFYVTTLLEPSEIMGDLNHVKTIENTIRSATTLGVSLERIIVTDNYSTVFATKSVETSDLAKIAKMHADSKFKLYLIDEKHFTDKFPQHDLNEEYLDFLLVEGQVIYGFKNDKKTYKTITGSDKYTLFIKDSKKELKNYKDFIVDIKKSAIQVTT